VPYQRQVAYLRYDDVHVPIYYLSTFLYRAVGNAGPFGERELHMSKIRWVDDCARGLDAPVPFLVHSEALATFDTPNLIHSKVIKIVIFRNFRLLLSLY